MTDKLSKERRSANMRAVKSHNTKPEKIVRQLAHKMGYRFRLHRADLPGKPDLVFPGRCAVIFVHGCFWHGHHCKRGALKPRTNTAFWNEKLSGNIKRDKRQLSMLREAGWRVLVIWECETKEESRLTIRLRKFLD
ncbi:MAG TPA: DNA mismatch endonuclease Vsr [Rhizomicrobium sp.]|nr:DNA mismatch endonuclease Vsr [Rhizomicrobium sp.]